jgi:uncharacterized protein YjbI with pentapeptide repeats
MANAQHLELLRLGTPEWNRWRQRNVSVIPDLSSAHLQRVRLSGADLSGAKLTMTYFGDADLAGADLSGADLSQAYLRNASLQHATLQRTMAIEAELSGADFSRTRMPGADLRGARLRGANLTDADLRGATLTGCDLRGAIAVGTNLRDADLTGSHVYGIAAWNVELAGSIQVDLLITPDGEHAITTDNLAIAQFLYLLLHNGRIRDAIETVGRKAILILGRFTLDRKAVLDAIRTALRKRNLVPILFDFEGPRNRDLTETISTLAHLSRAIVADLTDPRSVPHELMAVVPGLPSVPVQPIVEGSSAEYGMFEHLSRYPWVADVFRYSRLEDLTAWLPDALTALTPSP